MKDWGDKEDLEMYIKLPSYIMMGLILERELLGPLLSGAALNNKLTNAQRKRESQMP